MAQKCENCRCDCHCDTQEHSDPKGVCSCENCRCSEASKISDGMVIDDTNECEWCQ